MFVFLISALDRINAGLIWLKASPKVILSRRWIDATRPPSPMLNVGVFLQKPSRKPTTIKALNCIRVKKLLVGCVSIQRYQVKSYYLWINSAGFPLFPVLLRD